MDTLTKDQIDALEAAKAGNVRRIFGSHVGAHPSTIKALVKGKYLEPTYPCYGEVKFKPTKQGHEALWEKERANAEDQNAGRCPS